MEILLFIDFLYEFISACDVTHIMNIHYSMQSNNYVISRSGAGTSTGRAFRLHRKHTIR